MVPEEMEFQIHVADASTRAVRMPVFTAVPFTVMALPTASGPVLVNALGLRVGLLDRIIMIDCRDHTSGSQWRGARTDRDELRRDSSNPLYFQLKEAWRTFLRRTFGLAGHRGVVQNDGPLTLEPAPPPF